MARHFVSHPIAICLVACLAGLLSTGEIWPVEGSLDCNCPAVYDPVCITKTQITFPNNCTAACAGINDDWTRGSCEYFNPFDRYVQVVCLGDPCVVSSKDYPECMSAANCESVRYLNATNWKWPSSPIPPCSAVWQTPIGERFWVKTNLQYILAAQCSCSAIYEPVCGHDNQTYPSACTASCVGVSVAYSGACGAGSTDCMCTAEIDYVCGRDNRTYENACEAHCAGTTVQYSGTCTDVPVDRYPVCSPSPKPSTPPSPTAPTNSLPGTPPSELPHTPPTKSLPGSPPSEPPNTPIAPHTPVAPQANDSQTPPPSSSQQPSSLPPPLSRCGQCPMDYSPVCGVDYKNYPNSCMATCVGVRIRRTGKCVRCIGEGCVIGKLHDLCILAAPSASQCWPSKYECRSSPDMKNSDLLGMCMPKPAAPPSPRPSPRGRLM